MYEVTIEGSQLDVAGRSEADAFASGEISLRDRFPRRPPTHPHPHAHTPTPRGRTWNQIRAAWLTGWRLTACGRLLLRREGGEMVPCKPAELEYVSPTVARITLREGR